MSKLQEGDVFEVNEGMEVYAEIPERFIASNIKDSEKRREARVTVGRTFKNRYGEIGEELEEVEGDVYPTDYLIGEYVVINTEMTGGGTGHGPHDVYPDGWKVLAKKLSEGGEWDHDGVHISFYQSGSFTVVNKDIPVKGKLKMKFVKED